MRTCVASALLLALHSRESGTYRIDSIFDYPYEVAGRRGDGVDVGGCGSNALRTSRGDERRRVADAFHRCGLGPRLNKKTFKGSGQSVPDLCGSANGSTASADREGPKWAPIEPSGAAQHAVGRTRAREVSDVGALVLP